MTPNYRLMAIYHDIAVKHGVNELTIRTTIHEAISKKTTEEMEHILVEALTDLGVL